LLPHDKTEGALSAWLDTIAADPDKRPASLTLRPETGSQQPLLQEFSKLDSTSSAAPISVKGTLAEGGMGLIRLAEQEALGRTVVVKTLRENYTPHAAEHVLLEAWATGALEHPNIVPVHDIRVDDDGAPLIVLKRIEGLSWSDLMFDADAVNERFSASNLLEWNLSILKQVLQAVRFAHSRGILHRDLKPDNVMIGSFGEVYVVDWGIALGLECAGDNSKLPAAKDAQSMAGTPCYMAPEMLGHTPLDERTDVYLLGAILYEIISKEPPHQATSLEGIIQEIKTSSPEFPKEDYPLLSELCQRAMHKDPGQRFQSASEMGLALQDCLKHRNSRRIAAVAKTQHEYLREILSGDNPSRHDCYRRFGALRLGYIEALRVWPDNQEAQVAIDEARVEIIEYELAQGNPNAAHSVLTELTTPAPELSDRVQQAQHKQHSELAELEKYRDDSDLTVGSRTRIFIIAILGFAWTITPLLKDGLQVEWFMATYTGMTVITGTFMLVTSALWFWARESLTKTLINRRMCAAMAALFPCQFLLFAGGSLMGMPVLSAQLLMIFVWTLIASIVVVTIDKRFLPVAICYAAAFLIASRWPEYRFYLMSAGNLVLTIVAIYIWYPNKVEQSGTLFSLQKFLQSREYDE